MRRIVVALMGTVSGLVLLFSYHTSTNSSSGSAVATGPAAGKGSTGTSSGSTGSSGSSGSSGSGGSSVSPAPTGSTFTGTSASTRWGPVQVQITVADGKVTAAKAVVYPQANGRDQQINAYAIPQLNQETVAAQSATIDAVSGATVTSQGYVQSLQSALDQAHL